MPVNPLKHKFTVLRKLFKKMALDTDFSDMKKTFVSYPVLLIIHDWNMSVPFVLFSEKFYKKYHS